MEHYSVGQSASYTRTITTEDIQKFAALSGDNNPAHLDEAYAAGTRFGRCIAHGLFTASFFSTIFGTKLPGPGCIYTNQTLTFTKPVYIGDTVVASASIREIDAKRRRLYFDTVCHVGEDVVLSGQAEIYIPKPD